MSAIAIPSASAVEQMAVRRDRSSRSPHKSGRVGVQRTWAEVAGLLKLPPVETATD